MNITVREILPVDYPMVLSLWNNELGNQHVTSDNIAATYEKMKENDAYRTFVALLDDDVVGFITTVQVLAAGFQVGYLKINGLAVRSEYQGKGIGTALIRHVEAFASQKGISNIGVASGFQRVKAHAFYEKSGYEKGSYCFSKNIIT